MPIKLYNATTPGRRFASVDTFSDVTKKKPTRHLTIPKKRTGGRNFTGKITVRHHGGGAKQRYRLVDFKQDRFDVPATVEAIEYDPNRNSRIVLVKYPDGELRYQLAPIDVHVGDQLMTSKSRIDIKPGNRMPLEFVPLGLQVYNIELTPGNGGRLVRSAGNTAKLLAIEGPYATLRLPSSEVRLVPKHCLASIGQVSNPDAMHVRLGKAGRMRHLGVRPTVRGKVMNPVDHPHGGGEGVNPIGLKAPKTYTGKKALGVLTRNRKKYSRRLILQRRKK